MIFARIIKGIAERNWLTIFVELLVVVVGIFLGLQATQWHEDRQSRAEGIYYLDLLHRQLDAEIQMREVDLSDLSERIDQIMNAYQLLFLESWSAEEYSEFKSDHIAIYRVHGESRRPSALRQLIDNSKIDLVESRDIQEMIFALDLAYEEAISQSDITGERIGETTMIVAQEIPYGTRDDVMAIPGRPDDLLTSDGLKKGMRMTYIMNSIQQSASRTLQDECIRARDELTSYLSSQSTLGFLREES